MSTNPPQPRLTRADIEAEIRDMRGAVELATTSSVPYWKYELQVHIHRLAVAAEALALMDERDQLRDHVVAITIQREDLRDERSAAVEMFNQANREYGEVCVERDALRTALEQIRDMESDSYGTDDMHKIARAALSATSEASNAS